MNVQYFAPAAFPPLKTREMCGYESIQFSRVFLRTKYSRGPECAGPTAGNDFSAMHIQVAAFFINISGTVDASKTL